MRLGNWSQAIARLSAMYKHIVPLRLVCAWCQTVLREGREPTSHGICRDCIKQFEAKFTKQGD